MIKAILRSLLSLLLLLCTLVAFFSCTRMGTSLLIKITSALIPGQLQAQVARGYLLGNLHLKNIVYRNDTVNITVQELQVEWSIKKYSPMIIALPYIKVTNFVVNYPTPTARVYLVEKILINGQLALNDIAADATENNLQQKTHLLIAWQHMDVPINKKFDIAFPRGKLLLTGPLLNYHLRGKFMTAGNDFPHAKWQINQATGNFEHINVVSITGDPFTGKALLTGNVTWLPEVKWDGHLTGKNLTTLRPWPNLKNNVNLHIHSQGLITETLSQYRFELKNLTGEFDHHPLAGSGNMLISNDNYAFQQFHLSLGRANIKLDGLLNSNQADLNWQVFLPNLNELSPHIKGALNSTGSIHGNTYKPRILADITLQKAAWNTIAIDKLDAKLDVYPNFIDASQIQINAANIFAGNLTMQTFNLQFNNKQQQNQLTLNITGPRSQFKFNAQGKIVAQQWQGKIQELLLNMQQMGQVKLTQPTSLTLTQHSFDLQPFCLQAAIGKTCIQQASFAVANPSTQNNERTIKGVFALSSRDLAFIGLFLPQATAIQGNLDANFQVTGTTKNPLLTGQAALTKASLSIPQVGIHLTNIMAKAAGDQSNLNYAAQAKFGDGLLQINGKTELAKPGLPTVLVVKGNNLLVMNTQDAIVKISPDLQLIWQTPLLNVQGSIHIPFAKFTPRDLTSTITLPKDVVFVRPDAKTTEENTHIYSHVQIIFGDNISFNYTGLTGQVTGAVTVEDKPGGDTIGSGILTIENGKYKAYGQDLAIRQGKLIYTGGPINNPGVSVQAIKQLQVVTTSTGPQNSGSKNNLGNYTSNMQTVGVSVTGSLNQPSVKLFSEPAGLSQADILSYLIIGRPASQATEQDNPSIIQALSLLSLGDGGATGQLKNQLSHAFGLSEFSISHEQEYDKQNNSVVQNTSLLLGKALSPRLLLSYSLGLAEPINTLKIIYKLRNSIDLQSEHSTNANGVDLFYTYERN